MATETMDPWNMEFIDPSEYLISMFDKFDNTKSSASKRRSFHRAKKWISDLLQLPYKISDNDKLRHIDVVKALEDMTKCLAMPGGMSYDEYLKLCLKASPTSAQIAISDNNKTQEVPETPSEEENFQDAEDTEEIHKINSATQLPSASKNGDSEKILKNKSETTLLSAVDNDTSGKNEEIHTIDSATQLPSTSKNGVSGKILKNVSETPLSSAANNGTTEKIISKNANLNRKTVCRSIWVDKACQTINCPHAHPERCKDPDCFILDQGLPRWKVLQCRNWHHQPKGNTRIIGRNPQSRISKPRPQKSNQGVIGWTPFHNVVFPKFQTPWLNHSLNHSSNHSSDQIQNGFSGNGSAPWLTPLSRRCTSPWGNHLANHKIAGQSAAQKMTLSMEIARMMLSM